MALVFAICVFGYGMDFAAKSIEASHYGGLGKPCKPDGTCLGNLKCVKEEKRFHPGFWCQP